VEIKEKIGDAGGKKASFIQLKGANSNLEIPG